MNTPIGWGSATSCTRNYGARNLAARNTRQKDRYFEAAVEYQEQLTSPFRSATEAPRPPPPSRRRTLRTR